MPFFKFTVLLLALCLLFTGSGLAAEWSHDYALRHSHNFLKSLDDGRYEDALQSMSPLFNALNDSNQWIARQKALRDAYGAVISRSRQRLLQRENYVNSPDGDYVIVQYESVFINKSKAVETVIFHCTDLQGCLIREYVIN